MSTPCIEIPEQLFAPAESLSFSGTYDIPSLTQGADTYTFTRPLTWNVQVTNTGGALLVTGLVEADAVTNCVRCLEPATYELEGEVEGYYLIPGAEVELTEEEQEEYELLGEDHCIDLSVLLTSALALELPYTPLCSDECKGICPGCGANLNIEPCTCKKSEEDDFRPNPFSVLRTIEFDD